VLDPRNSASPTLLLLTCALGTGVVAGCASGPATGDAGARSDGGGTPEASWAEAGADADAAPVSYRAPPCSAADAGDAQIATHDMGTVLFEDYSTSSLSGGLSASFEATGTVIAPPGCTVTTVGACQVSALCDLSLPDIFCNSANAGVISVEDDEDAGSSTIMIPPQPPNSAGGGGGWYLGTRSGGFPLFLGGDSLTVAAEGGVVPAFGASLVAPSYVTLTEPAPQNDGGNVGAYVIATSSDLAVSWNGGEADATVHVVVRALQNSPAPNTYVADCAFDALAGKGVVPGAALSLLKGRYASQFTVYQQRVRTVQAGTFVVQIIARNACDLYAGGLEGPCFVNNERAILE
jgi:hypothetical protein